MDREQKELPSDLDLVKNKKLKTHHGVLKYTEKDQKVFLISHLLGSLFCTYLFHLRCRTYCSYYSDWY